MDLHYLTHRRTSKRESAASTTNTTIKQRLTHTAFYMDKQKLYSLKKNQQLINRTLDKRRLIQQDLQTKRALSMDTGTATSIQCASADDLRPEKEGKVGESTGKASKSVRTLL